MRRMRGTPRPNWRQTIQSQGLVFGTPARDGTGGSREYWDESVFYEFDMDEVLSLEAQVGVLHSMCLQAVENVILTERYADFGIPEWAWGPIEESWKRQDPHVYGRFDLRYDGRRPAKLLEYNADTPTSLLEAAVVQWYWFQETSPDTRPWDEGGYDQWNSLHESLVERWGEIKKVIPPSELHFAWSSADESGEDHVTTGYLQETAAEAGFDTVGLPIEDIGWDHDLKTFVDLEDAPINAVFKLYPWEWVLEDDFGKRVAESLPATTWIEPLWKAILSNKAILAVLWEMFPDHPNLLPAYIDNPGFLTEYVKKPKLGREGANLTIVDAGRETATGGVYGAEGYVYQLFDPLPEFDGYHPVIGAWIVGDEPAGIGIRETSGLITDDGAAFIPHRITPKGTPAS
ncbi:Glutathionylspermidine synthase OS=Tsukamurella paurometabola (strain ATCC 8368 / DSM / CCUG 35730 / CIP 100753 / JCM 10117 / KCTC 9821 / NBRC 16120 / NCIMB 702349 / NCTC 13040) OX=521096 GN=Tpau_1573 PE=4 SV=1 [Tsukamurella paurometabola]|uniref:Glutathionylspermidine synthase n=1 Tax=Tsukamurella paurometabola (strain ATCC 8368 / DSM 20162 / CCUG 35730 / CIP 100753 / JCM 10117 / KCTC 9821 / NBRC 16120 / NCIMB 702349 / NCTC 13040) TaxID=521096 RepID=D5UY87_TSUPD|nr:glutathionylspermidine synthase family protein [Tsukamurella paurometabola]ADG78194.1 glutathionylspermidine synthase [Tsukamurella paurometabola DSM 20162]SUP30620.1 Bifunctional glutathionylspermidine synthetase/amidase [Tsukamurella paurometabola]